MTVFEPWTFGIGSDRSTNLATQPLPKLITYLTVLIFNILSIVMSQS